MITTAVPDGEDGPTLFILDVRDRPWDGSAGLRLMAEWDGMGMAATQSHAMRLEACPAIRIAWEDRSKTLTARSRARWSRALFTAVILGVVDEAIRTAEQQLAPKAERCGRTSRSSGRAPSSTTGSPCRPTKARCGPWSRATSPDRCYATLRGEGGGGGAGRVLAGPSRRGCIGGGTFSRRSPVRVVVRGRPCARFPPAAVGTRLRQPVPHVARARRRRRPGGPHGPSARRPDRRRGPRGRRGPSRATARRRATIATKASHSAR